MENLIALQVLEEYRFENGKIMVEELMQEEMKKKETEKMALQMLMMKRERLMKVVGYHLDKSTNFDITNQQCIHG